MVAVGAWRATEGLWGGSARRRRPRLAWVRFRFRV
ncbi:hypothetical protein M6B38_362480 [Iris pallida]|uniref:Uncharacterized protein n=1 Tax=Iris pallida TaxID=29817 RepID=A0AAX6GII2_IRIPA|nr:hypothetical protein M6B38_362480 [Iris pallida]